MFDRFDREIDYIRVSVTDRCNLRCIYCMPEKGIELAPHHEVLSFEEITSVVRTAVGMGVRKVRLTGGDPLVRKGIVCLTGMFADIPGIEDLAMSTNGQLLEHFARPLARAGLNRVNISLDSLDPERYSEITRGGDVSRVRAGIMAARDAGLVPVKLNCVVRKDSSEPDAREVAGFAAENGFEIRFIRQMTFSRGQFWPVEGGRGGVCRECNRLRLTSTGKIMPCLFSDLAFDVRELGPERAIREAVRAKPEMGSSCSSKGFNRIGG